MSKSFKPLLIKLVAVCAIVAAWCGGGLMLPSSLAQQPLPTPPARKAYLRFWNMLPVKPTNNLLVLINDKDPLTGAAPSNIYTQYVPAPVGSYTLVIKRTGDKGEVLQRLPAALPDNGFVTLLVTEKNGQTAAELFNDTPDPNKPETTARVTLRQFVPGGRATISTAGLPASQPASSGETAVLEGITAGASVNVGVQVAMPTTPPTSKNWVLPVDFTKVHRATILLIADSYGRPRPQISYDAQPPNEAGTPTR